MYEKFLNRLPKLRANGKDRWRAQCPAHDSNSHSLSCAIASDNRLLIKCHVGCSAWDVLQAVGCDWEDVFPEENKHDRSLIAEFGIKPAGTVADRVVDLAAHSKALTVAQAQEAERAALRGARSDGFSKQVAAQCPENKQWAEQLLSCERELHRAEMALGQEWGADL